MPRRKGVTIMPSKITGVDKQTDLSAYGCDIFAEIFRRKCRPRMDRNILAKRIESTKYMICSSHYTYWYVMSFLFLPFPFVFIQDAVLEI